MPATYATERRCRYLLDRVQPWPSRNTASASAEVEDRVKLPPLVSEHPRPVQFGLIAVVPAIFGAICGYFLGVSAVTYLVLSVIGVVGGVGAGLDHLGARAGARRGVAAGSIFGGAILIAHEIHGAEPTVELPEPPILLVVLTTVLGAGFAAIGGWLRERHERK
jgi:hypothetical protein